MADDEKSTKQVIQLAEICRVEGHAAVDVTIDNGKIESVKLNVFEGTRFFERIVLGHKYDEMPTSPRVFAPFAPLAMCWQQYLPLSVHLALSLATESCSTAS